jgi:hypothetical protein
MGAVAPNVLSAITPTAWSQALQVPLYKSLVSMEIADTKLMDQLEYGNTLRINYFDSLTAGTYTPGSTFDLDEVRYVGDSIKIDQYRYTAIYVDEPETLLTNIDVMASLTEEMAYQLKDVIDQQVLYNTSAGVPMDDYDMTGGTASALVTASSANIINIFANARKQLRIANVEDVGDWIAVLPPTWAYFLETKAVGAGFNFADSTLRNGFVGQFMGFKIYISNNCPTQTTASATATRGIGTSGTSQDIYFGRSKQIKLFLKKAPTIQIKEVANQIGKNIVCWTLFGDGVPTKSGNRFLDVQAWYAAGA